MKTNLHLVETLIFTIVLVLAGMSLSPDAKARSLNNILKSKEIRICLAGSSKNFYKQNAMAFVKFLNENHADNGLQAKYISFEKWNDQFVKRDGTVDKEAMYIPEPLASERCDLYPNDLVKLEWRQKKLAYVDLFYSRSTIIINKTKVAGYKKIEDLAGKTAAVMEGTSYHTILENLNESELKNNPIKIVFLPQKEAIKAVSSDKYDFAISGADGAFWAITNFAPKAAVAFPVGEKKRVYGWCFRKEDKDLQEAVRTFFSGQLSQIDSEINMNWTKYIGISLSDFALFVN